MNKGDTQVSKEKNGNARTTILLNGKITKDVLEELYRIGSSTKVLECKNMILTILYEAATRGRRTVSIMYRANMGPINNVEATFVKLEQDGYNVRRSDRTACSPTWTIGF